MLQPKLHPHLVGLIPPHRLEWVKLLVSMGHWEVGNIHAQIDRGALILDLGICLHMINVSSDAELCNSRIPNLERPFGRVLAVANQILWASGPAGLTAVTVDQSKRILGVPWVETLEEEQRSGRIASFPPYRTANPLHFIFGDPNDTTTPMEPVTDTQMSAAEIMRVVLP